MGFLNRLFGEPKKQQTLYDDFLKVGVPLVVNGYRRVAAQRGCAPGPNVPDAKIIEIYQRVGEAFQTAAQARGEHIPATILNHVVLYFFTNYEMFGDDMFESHLEYEVAKYSKHGLRENYKQHLSLF